MKMPKFHGPHFGGGAKGDVDVEIPDAHIDGGGKIDLDAGVDVETPDVRRMSIVPMLMYLQKLSYQMLIFPAMLN